MQNDLFLRSMTAYGKASCDLDDVSFAIEITSVNRKHLEVSFNIPKHLQYLELDFRKIVASKLSRGNVHVNIRCITHKDSSKKWNFGSDFSYIKDLKAFLERLKAELNLNEEISLDLLLRYRDICKSDYNDQDISEYQDILKEKFLDALMMLLSHRELEGKEVGKSIVLELTLLLEFVNKIKEFIPTITEIYKKKITSRILELDLLLEDKNKLLKEISLLLDKIDITEEIVRVLSHIEQMYFIIQKPFNEVKEAKGRQLEFLTQEILRELNTMGVKSSELSVIKLIVDAKIELEKIREQLQNIE